MFEKKVQSAWAMLSDGSILAFHQIECVKSCTDGKGVQVYLTGRDEPVWVGTTSDEIFKHIRATNNAK